MSTYDPKKAAEVWKRVQSPFEAAPNPADLLAMITEERLDAVTYLHLSRFFRGSSGALLRRMSQQEQSHATCLTGIYTLLTGERPKIRTLAVPKQAPQVLLRQCYGREMHCLAQYEARTNDPEYGQVFARMAQQEREHCRQLLEILGQLQEKE